MMTIDFIVIQTQNVNCQLSLNVIWNYAIRNVFYMSMRETMKIGERYLRKKVVNK